MLNWPLKPDRLEMMLPVAKPSQQVGEGVGQAQAPGAFSRGA